MSEATNGPKDKSMFSTKTAFVVGYTGEVGKQLTKELLKSKVFDRVRLIGRRSVDLGEGVSDASNADQIQIDFDAIDQCRDAFSGANVGFCCLGTTRAKSGKEGFIKVDHDYVLNVARMAKECGCEQFHLVTSGGADKNSFTLYFKTKGLAEEHVTELAFPRFSIYRPGLLLSDRQETRLAEKVSTVLMKPINFLFPTKMSVNVNTLGKAMIANLWNKLPADKPVDIVDNPTIHKLGSDYDHLFEQT